MRGRAAFALMLSASVLVLAPAYAQDRSTTGAAPPLVPAASAPATDTASAPESSIVPSLSLPVPIAAPPALAPVATSPLAPVPSTANAQPPAAAAAAPPRTPAGPSSRTHAQAVPAAAPGRAPLPALTPQGAPSAAPAPSRTGAHCDNPNALGVARTVEIDTTGGPGFGFEHFRQHDFLRDKEVVLTFDDGPWVTTPLVLKALAAECVRATFFSIGKHATYYPEILREVAKAGHTVGSHTWSHQDLSKKTFDEAKDEIEKAVSAVKWALEDQGQAAPFFRFPALKHPPELVTYLGERNIAIFSTDMDSFDFKMRKPEQVIHSIMTKLQKHGKGIVLMHDFQQATAHAVPQLLAQLKAGGYKIVHMKPRNAVVSLQQYDEELLKDQKLPTVSQRPTSSVVRTVE
jgi:peptidoglycan/xylan/chitin deacetylase (PgdA/CDA1 family)